MDCELLKERDSVLIFFSPCNALQKEELWMHGKYFLNKCVALVKSLSLSEAYISFLQNEQKVLSPPCWRLLWG